MDKHPPFQLHLRPIWFGLAYSLLLLVTLLSLMPVTLKVDVDGSDKIGHFLAYAALSASFSLIVNQRKSLWLIFFGLVGYGLIIEYLQGLTDYRQSEFNDAIANSLGALFGLLARFSPLRNILQRIDFFLYKLS